MKLADLRGRKRTLIVVSVVMIAFGWFLHPDSDATIGQFRSVADHTLLGGYATLPHPA